MTDMYKYVKEVIKKTNEKDKTNMPLIYQKSSEDEKVFIDEVMKKFKKYQKDIIYNEKNGCLNFCYNNMQIGKIRLNNKKRRMQILTEHNVEWQENISLPKAIDNIDIWYKYLNNIIKN